MNRMRNILSPMVLVAAALMTLSSCKEEKWRLDPQTLVHSVIEMPDSIRTFTENLDSYKPSFKTNRKFTEVAGRYYADQYINSLNVVTHKDGSGWWNASYTTPWGETTHSSGEFRQGYLISDLDGHETIVGGVWVEDGKYLHANFLKHEVFKSEAEREYRKKARGISKYDELVEAFTAYEREVERVDTVYRDQMIYLEFFGERNRFLWNRDLNDSTRVYYDHVLLDNDEKICRMSVELSEINDNGDLSVENFIIRRVILESTDRNAPEFFDEYELNDRYEVLNTESGEVMGSYKFIVGPGFNSGFEISDISTYSSLKLTALGIQLSLDGRTVSYYVRETGEDDETLGLYDWDERHMDMDESVASYFEKLESVGKELKDYMKENGLLDKKPAITLPAVLEAMRVMAYDDPSYLAYPEASALDSLNVYKNSKESEISEECAEAAGYYLGILFSGKLTKSELNDERFYDKMNQVLAEFLEL